MRKLGEIVLNNCILLNIENKRKYQATRQKMSDKSLKQLHEKISGIDLEK